MEEYIVTIAVRVTARSAAEAEVDAWDVIENDVDAAEVVSVQKVAVKQAS